MNISAGSTYTEEEVKSFFQKTNTPEPVFEYEFHPARNWRFDLAWPSKKLALEVQGGLYTGGRHTTAQGFLNDMEKDNAAAVIGWRILKVTPKGLLSFGTTSMIQKALQ
jgi:hypothetical protein